MVEYTIVEEAEAEVLHIVTTTTIATRQLGLEQMSLLRVRDNRVLLRVKKGAVKRGRMSSRVKKGRLISRLKHLGSSHTSSTLKKVMKLHLLWFIRLVLNGC